MNNRETELAWCAGFFDGEGCTSLKYQKRKYPRLVCTVSQKGRIPLDRFVSAVGFGTINGPYTKPDVYQLRFAGSQATQLLDLLWPYLSEPKREQARTKGYKGLLT